jgi:hypothetical protein
VQAVGQEGDEDVRFDTMLKLVVDRAELQIVHEILERGLDLDELDIELPQLGRILVVQIGAQQVAAFAAAPFRSSSRSSAKLKVAALGAILISIRRHAALALARAAPSFMTSSSRVRPSIASICLSRAHSHLSLRRRMARSLLIRAWLCAST